MFKRGHQLRTPKGNLTILPGPGDSPDGEDPDGPDVIFEGEEPGGPDEGLPDWLNVDPADAPATPRPTVKSQVSDPGDEPPRPPGHLRRPPPKAAADAKTPARVTVAIRKDIHAKVRVILKPAAELWAVRDGTCGPVAVRQEPDISEAIANIVCDSPDLVAFFTGPAGGFMKYFELLIACWPVVMTAQAHHLAHRGPRVQGDPTQPPQAPAFAALCS